jgi:UDP:flavonoid glycosyltransferase YjiC (YdhE family)
MHHRVPLLVLPFSTDQFAGAADIERAGFGVALAPNEASVDELADALRRVLSTKVALEPTSGPDLAYASFSKTS